LLLLLLQAIKSVGLGDVMTDEELDAVMNLADTNGSGAIEYQGNKWLYLTAALQIAKSDR